MAGIAVEAHDNKQPPLCLPKAHEALLPCWPLLMPIAPAAAAPAAAARETSVQLVHSAAGIKPKPNGSV